jgi:hypothetical protein
MTAWRRVALALVRALRVRLRGQPLDDDPNVVRRRALVARAIEIRDPDGALHAVMRPMTTAEIREAQTAARGDRERGWLERRPDDPRARRRWLS